MTSELANSVLDVADSKTSDESAEHIPGQSEGMSFLDHLGELRQRIINSSIALVVGILIAFITSRYVIGLLKQLAPDYVSFVQIAPGEVLMASFKLSFIIGIMLASPVILYQTLRFVIPGLNTREKQTVLLCVFFGAVLFAGGVAFSYWAVIPPALGFLLEYGHEVAESQISIARFIEFCASLLILTGTMFELPMILFFLSMTGLITSRQLLAQWRGAIVGIMLASAILTPSQDPFTMLIVGGALILLYLGSIIPIKLCGR